MYRVTVSSVPLCRVEATYLAARTITEIGMLSGHVTSAGTHAGIIAGQGGAMTPPRESAADGRTARKPERPAIRRYREALGFGVATLGILIAGYVLLYLAAPHTELSNLATIAAGILPTSGLAALAFVAGQRRSTLDLLSIIGVFAAWVLAQWIIY